MLIDCPNCKKTFDLQVAGTEAARKFRCSNCRAVFRVVRKGAGRQKRLTVVIANESDAFCLTVQKVLCHEPFEVFTCSDGRVALETVERVKPDLLLLDVALPTMLGFEVCERVRQNPALSGTKIVLIASVYDKTRYKRSPVSLYGADDYIEKHHIPDALIPMIHRLASGRAPLAGKPSASQLAAQLESRSEIRRVELSETWSSEPATAGEPPAAASPGRPAAEPDEAAAKARRLARIIVSDIALYNQQKVEQGVREGNLRELLADDIREGELLYSQRVSPQLRESTAFLAEAFEELVTKKRAELRI
jgi:CheY-like chemotaxis protein